MQLVIKLNIAKYQRWWRQEIQKSENVCRQRSQDSPFKSANTHSYSLFAFSDSLDYVYCCNFYDGFPLGVHYTLYLVPGTETFEVAGQHEKQKAGCRCWPGALRSGWRGATWGQLHFGRGGSRPGHRCCQGWGGGEIPADSGIPGAETGPGRWHKVVVRFGEESHLLAQTKPNPHDLEWF